MDNPQEDITAIVHRLTQGSPADQTEAIDAYFTPDASFTHPICRTGSFDGSRKLIHAIYRWYKLMSPEVDLRVNSVAYDETNLKLYLNISQTLFFRFVPFHHPNVTLTTELQLTRPPNSGKYYIRAQNDLYQNDQLMRFFVPFGFGQISLQIWQYMSTIMCVMLASLLGPAEKWIEGTTRRSVGDVGAGNTGNGTGYKNTFGNGSSFGYGGFSSAEEEMKNLVNSAMEGLGYQKSLSGNRRTSPGAASGGSEDDSNANGTSARASGSDGTQQFGNMIVP